jgi:hypothetical protein
MSPMQSLGKFLLFAGALMVLLGGIVILAGKVGLPLGRLPGDFTFRGKHVLFFAPIGTMVLVSLVLTILVNLFLRWLK